jgi:hypothetical protein
MKHTALALTLLATLGLAQADNGPPSSGGPGNNPALDAALKECAASAGKSSDGRPNFTAMEACMKTKGFEKPSKPPAGVQPPSSN